MPGGDVEGARRYSAAKESMIFDRGFVVEIGARYRKLLLAGTALAVAALLPSIAQAQSVWGGASATTNTSDYNLGTNWSTNPVAPTAAGSSAQFSDGTGGSGGTASTSVTVTAGPITPDSWTFLSNSQSYTVTGALVHFANAATLTNNASAGQAIIIANNMIGATLSQAAGSTLTLSGTNNFTGTSVTAGTLVNSGNLTSALTNSATYTNTGTLNGGLTNTGVGGTTNNSGTINGGATVTGGILLTNSATSIINGGLTNSAGVNASNQVNGAILNQGAGGFTVFGVLTGNSTFTNNGTAQLVVNGDFSGITTLTNNSTSAVAVLVTAGRTLTTTTTIANNAGTFSNNGTVTTTGGTTNAAGATFSNDGIVNGGLSNAGTANNFDTLNGGLSQTAGTTINSHTINNGATITGGTLNTSATTSVINGGLTTSATVNAAGQVNGAILNQGAGAFSVSGTLTGNSTFTNNGTAQLAVSGGDFTGISTFTNNSSSALAVVVSAGRTLGATGIVNSAGIFTNNGTLSGDVTNTGTFNNSVGATTTGHLSQSAGTTTNNGSLIGQVTLTGGTLTTTGTLVNGIISTNAIVNAQGSISNISNLGSSVFTVTGALTTGNIFNSGTAQLQVSAGNLTGSSLLTNNSTSSQAVQVSVGHTLEATMVVNNAGTFTNNGITNASLSVTNNNVGTSFVNNGTLTTLIGFTNGTGASFVNSGILNSSLDNTGSAGNSGIVNGFLSNYGTYTQTAGATNNGAINSGGINANGGAFNGGIVNSYGSAGGSFIVGGTVTSDSTFNNSVAASRLIVDFGATYTVAGAITNSGTNAAGGILVAAGATLTGNGGITNNAGATINNLGIITTSSMLNNGTITGAYAMAGGTLSGVGNTQNLTVNGGTFAPGNGTAGSSMTVTGSLVLQSAATYLVQINPNTASFTSVTGAATLNGGTVSANFANGSYIAKHYTIVTAAGDVNGTFGSVTNTNLPGGFKSSLSYDTKNAYLDLTLDFTPTPTPNFSGGLSGNQQAVGNALINFFNSTGGIPIVFGTLTPGGLTQISGETATGSQQTTFNAMNQFMGVMTDPFIAGRSDPISGGGIPSAFAGEEESLAYAANGKSRSKSERDAYAAIYRKAPPMAPAFAQRWSVWAAGFGGSQTTDGKAVAGSNDTKSSIYGTAVGADYRISPDTLVGFSLAGGGTNFSVNGYGSGRSDLFQAGAFIRHTIGAAYLSGALAYGWQDITTDRTVTVAGIDRLRAEFNANTWSGRVEGGYRLVAQGFGWTPYAAGQFTTFELPNYAESVVSGANTFALAYASKSVSSTRSELGLRSDKSFAMQDGIFTLRGRAAWAHDFNPNRASGATFQTLPGASFVVNGAMLASDSALTTASAEMKWLNGWSASATFEGEFSNVTSSYAGKGAVRYTW
jgi:uncharacterized protein with beta-barrel porin domain